LRFLGIYADSAFPCRYAIRGWYYQFTDCRQNTTKERMEGDKMRFKLTIVAAVLMALFATFAGTVLAQETRGTIRGTVSDPNGQPVLNATVVVTDVPRGTKTTLTTNGEGFYQALFLLPSTYQISVEAAGFKKAIREGVTLQIAQQIAADILLEVGGAEETVTVTGAVPTLNTENASLGTVVDQQKLAELPLANGDPYKLIGTAGGVSYQGDERLDRPYEPTHIVGYAVNGVRSNRMDLTIDGVASTATANENEVTASYVPPSEVVQEFKVQTATFDAQFGNTEGSVTSIVIKSGTNDFHGSVYSFWQPSAIGANDAFGKARGQERVESKSDRYGGYVSGPIRFPWLYNGKDKSFFLFGLEFINDARPRSNISPNLWVPTAALRNGDFSAYTCPTPTGSSWSSTCTNIYDPLTATGSSETRTQFAGNIIPANRISPVAKAIMGYMGEPKNPGLAGNINDSNLLETTDYYNWTFRVDQQLTSKNRMFVRGSWYTREGLYNRYTDSAYAGQNFSFLSRGGVIDDVHTFNSTTFLNVKYGYNRFIRYQQSQDDSVGFDLTNLWGPTQGAAYNNLIPEAIRRFPVISTSTGNGSATSAVTAMLGSNTVTNEIRPNDSHNAVAILNKTWGNHSLKFGGELRIYRENQNQQNQSQTGTFNFNNQYTRRTSNTGLTVATGGPQDYLGLQSFAAFLLGLPTTQSVFRATDYSEYSKTWGFFVQDDFRVGSRLTINAGLRYEKEIALAERQDKSVSGFDYDFVQPTEVTVRSRLTSNPVVGLNGQAIDPSTYSVRGGLLFSGKDTEKLYNTPNNTFLPRFGAAYRLFDKTVIRGGIGLFAGFLGQRRSDVLQPGFTRTTTLGTTVNANGRAIPYSIDQFPSLINILEPVGNTAGKETGLGGAIAFFNEDAKPSKQLRWQFGVQHEFAGGLFLEAVYVGNYGYDIEHVKNINALPSKYLVAGGIVNGAEDPAVAARTADLNRTVANPFQGLYAGGNNTASTIALNVLLRPFPQFGNANVLTRVNDGKSWYHSGQFGVMKRFKGGSSLQANYTWSKWLQAVEYLNSGDDAPTKMISDQDVPHRFSATGTWKLPFGKGQVWDIDNAIVDGFVGGWQLNANYQVQSGVPLQFGSYSFTGNANGNSSGDIYYLGGDIAVDNPTVDAWFNSSAFSTVTPTIGHLRTLPYRFSDVRSHTRNNVDLSLMKYITFTESMKLQIRLEALNALNRVYYPAATTAIGSSFGKVSGINQANYPRRFQIGLKFMF
jgi:hypothetical protein